MRIGTNLESRNGVSAIELLCTITIILILAGMLLGPVLKAYRKVKSFAGEEEGPGVVQLAVDRLRRFHRAHTVYGALSVDYLNKEAIFDTKFMQYLREKKITYYTFASTDPDDKPIMAYAFSKDSSGLIMKSQVTAAPGER
jgi:prepilin-type N-terminal cleavage/methylation domain-containing protein